MSFHALRAQLVRVIDLQNRVFLDDAKQEQQSQPGKNIYCLPGQQQRQNAERYREGSVKRIVIG